MHNFLFLTVTFGTNFAFHFMLVMSMVHNRVFPKLKLS